MMDGKQADRLIVPMTSPDVSLELVGGKGKSLARLAISGLPVPIGFILTTTAYREFVTENNLQSQIAALIAEHQGNPEPAAKKIQSLFTTALMSDEISAAISESYAELGDNPAVAVRSSATAEDRPDMSFAGLHDTYLNICGVEALTDAILHCWASLWTARAIAYRHKMNVDHQLINMAVVIQAMVQAEASGVLFTANPVTGSRSEIVINASFGLGESIVSGSVTPDTFVLDKNSLETISTELGTKEEMTVASGTQGTTQQPVSASRRATLSLDADVLTDLGSLGVETEQLFDNVPQDIEWAVLDHKCYLLQSRPITNLPVAPLHDIRWDPPYKGGKLIRRQVVENMPDPLSPLFEELYLEVGLELAIDKLMTDLNAPFDIAEIIVRPIFVTVNGYAYCRADYKIRWRSLLRIFPWYFKVIPFFLRNIITQWRDIGLPDYLTAIEQWKNIDMDNATDEQLMDGVRALTIADANYWFSVAMIMGMAKIADGALHTFLSVAVSGELISGMFLRGFPSRTLEAQAALETLSKKVLAIPTLCELVQITPATRLPETLRQDEEGASVAEDIQQYLEMYGHQIYTLDFVQQTQSEDPLPVMLSLKALVGDATADITLQQVTLLQERETLEKQTSASLGPVRRWMFRKLLNWAQTYGPYREEALFYMGAAWPTVRKMCLCLGNRLVAREILTEPEDLFYLRSAEINEACSSHSKLVHSKLVKKGFVQKGFVQKESVHGQLVYRDSEQNELEQEELSQKNAGQRKPTLGNAASHFGHRARQRVQLREARKQLHPPPMVPEGRINYPAAS